MCNRTTMKLECAKLLSRCIYLNQLVTILPCTTKLFHFEEKITVIILAVLIFRILIALTVVSPVTPKARNSGAGSVSSSLMLMTLGRLASNRIHGILALNIRVLIPDVILKDPMYCISLAIRQSFFFVQNNPKI